MKADKKGRAVCTLCNGVWRENPILILMLGLCPTLAVSASAADAFGMGIAFLFVLTLSNVIISLTRKIVPHQIRIPVFITIIATVVTVTDSFIAGFFPPLHRNLGIFLPLIVVNCIVLGRAEAYASRNSIFLSFLDGFGMGIGFTAIITFIGAIREVLGNGTLWGKAVMPSAYPPFLLFLFPPGAFLIMAFLIAIHRSLTRLKD